MLIRRVETILIFSLVFRIPVHSIQIFSNALLLQFNECLLRLLHQCTMTTILSCYFIPKSQLSVLAVRFSISSLKPRSDKKLKRKTRCCDAVSPHFCLGGGGNTVNTMIQRNLTGAPQPCPHNSLRSSSPTKLDLLISRCRIRCCQHGCSSIETLSSSSPNPAWPWRYEGSRCWRKPRRWSHCC
jgi:hypothetical protein